MKLAACRILLIFGGLFIMAPVNAFNVNLAPGKWYLLSVPGEPDRTVADLFRSELAEGDYNNTWAVYIFDKSSQNYDLPTVNDLLPTGEAFWFIHYSNTSIGFEVPEDMPDVPLALLSSCPSEGGCLEYELPTGSGVSWSMIGTPFLESVVINDIRLVTDSGPCQSGCTIAQAYDAGMSGNTFYAFDAVTNAYELLVNDDLLMAGDGHWFPTTIAGEFGPAKLLIPNFCN